ncbi:DNA cytosine methyltransferase [Micromonospora arida]|uniref:DNA cytosine methyltransferase n=1 Tax=Micromonospora arida TaxID=2203715 RepID=UPI003CF2D684
MSTYGVKLLRSDDLQLPAEPNACTPETFVDWSKKQIAAGRPLAVDLFSGAGGLSLGLTEAGWTVAAAVDHDAKALATHRANFPGLALDVDLGDDTARRSLIRLLQTVKIDLVAGGPPCQPFSRAGRSKIRSLVEAGVRDEHDHRKELWRSFVDVVLKLRPRAVLMENVPDMALGDEMFVVRTIVAMLENANYRTEVRLVDAWKFGVPQHRQRLILLARNDDGDFTWPAEQTEFTTLREAIGDLPPLELGTGARVMGYNSKPESDYAKEMRLRAPDDLVHDHMTRPVRDDDREIFSIMTSKTLYSEIDPKLRRYKADTFDDKYKRLDWEDRSRSITAHIAKDGYWYIHPEENRTLTVREAARIQTFPDRFRFAGTRSDAFRQIGNAVPPLLGKAAATAVQPMQELPLPRQDRDWVALRKRLAQWATLQRRSENWYLFPSEPLSPTIAALVAMLRGQPGLGAALENLRGSRSLTLPQLEALSGDRSAPRLRVAAERLMAALEELTDPGDPVEVAEKVRFQPAELELYRLLLGEDRLIPSQPAVRVAARVLTSTSADSHLRTRGRLDLALLVGSGPAAPGRMAAIRIIGSVFCKPDQEASDCAACPIRNVCDSSTADRATRSTRSAASVTA